MEWFDYSIPPHPPGDFDSNKFDAVEDMFYIQVKDELFGEDWWKSFATEILDAKYEKTDVAEVMKGLTHLNAHEIADLPWVLQENKKMFDETLDVYPHKKVHINIDPNAKPVHSMPHPLPWIYLKTFKKKDNRVRWIRDSHYLNRVIRHKQCLLCCRQSWTFCASVLGTSFSLNLTIVCNTIHMSLTTKSRLLYHHHTIW